MLFEDDDLRIEALECRCGLAYVRAWRRIPRSYRMYLIPASDEEVAELASLGGEDGIFAEKYFATQAAVVRLAEQRAHIQLENPDQEPWTPQWDPAGTPFAFLWAPS